MPIRVRLRQLGLGLRLGVSVRGRSRGRVGVRIGRIGVKHYVICVRVSIRIRGTLCASVR